MADEFIIPADRKSIIWVLILIWLLFGGMSAILIAQHQEITFAAFILGLLIVLSCYMLPSAFSTRPVLIIDAIGIEHHTSGTGTGLTRWEEMARIYDSRTGRTRWIGIDIIDLPSFLRKRGIFQKLLIRFNMSLGYPPVLINGTWLKCPLEDVFEAIVRYGPAALEDLEQSEPTDL